MWVIGALAALGGCHLRHHDSCATREPYQSAVSAQPLRAAEGLAPANTKNALKIPEAVAPAAPKSGATGCLDQPPSFFADRPRPAVKK
jgi:hypothetical protein